jgi:hypothetical protein
MYVRGQRDVARLDGFRKHLDIYNDFRKTLKLPDLEIGIRHKVDQASQEQGDEQLGDDKEGKIPLDGSSWVMAPWYSESHRVILGRIQSLSPGGRMPFTSAKDNFGRFLSFLEEGNVLHHTTEAGK